MIHSRNSLRSSRMGRMCAVVGAAAVLMAGCSTDSNGSTTASSGSKPSVSIPATVASSAAAVTPQPEPSRAVPVPPSAAAPPPAAPAPLPASPQQPAEPTGSEPAQAQQPPATVPAAPAPAPAIALGAPCNGSFQQFAQAADGTTVVCLGMSPGHYYWRDVPELIAEVAIIGEPCSYDSGLASTPDSRAAVCVDTGKGKTWMLWVHD